MYAAAVENEGKSASALTGHSADLARIALEVGPPEARADRSEEGYDDVKSGGTTMQDVEPEDESSQSDGSDDSDGSDEDSDEESVAESETGTAPAGGTSLLAGGPKSEHERDFDSATAEADAAPVILADTTAEDDKPGPARAAASLLHYSPHDRVVVARAAVGVVTLDEGTVLLHGRRT